MSLHERNVMLVLFNRLQPPIIVKINILEPLDLRNITFKHREDLLIQQIIIKVNGLKRRMMGHKIQQNGKAQTFDLIMRKVDHLEIRVILDSTEKFRKARVSDPLFDQIQLGFAWLTIPSGAKLN